MFDIQESRPASTQHENKYSPWLDSHRFESGGSVPSYARSFNPNILDISGQNVRGSPSQPQEISENYRFRPQTSVGPVPTGGYVGTAYNTGSYGGNGASQTAGYRAFNNGFSRSSGTGSRSHNVSDVIRDSSMMEGFFSYTLKPIPPTGPRFIR